MPQKLSIKFQHPYDWLIITVLISNLYVLNHKM
jgi:hypothetical protein